jgi:hypothetical protein
VPDRKHQHPSHLRRCVVNVTEDLLRKDPEVSVADALSRSYAICTATMQKAGYFEKDETGRQRHTEKGKTRQRHFSAMKDFGDYEQRYENLLAAARDERAEARKSRPAAARTSARGTVRATNGGASSEALALDNLERAVSAVLRMGLRPRQVSEFVRRLARELGIPDDR